MKISFSIPAHNEENNIGACIEAIQKELALNNIEWDIIVVDNASTDNTSKVANKYSGVKVVHESRKGLLFSRQKGFLESQGELVANIDADTRITSGWVKTVIKNFNAHRDLVALSGPFIYFDLPLWARIMTSLFYGIGYSFHLMAHIIRGKSAMLQGGNFVVRKSALEKAGGFNTAISFYGEDTEVAKRLSRYGKVKFDFSLKAETSGRRLEEEGILATGFRYAINHFWVIFFDKPYTSIYTDVRSNNKK